MPSHASYNTEYSREHKNLLIRIVVHIFNLLERPEAKEIPLKFKCRL